MLLNVHTMKEDGKPSIAEDTSHLPNCTDEGKDSSSRPPDESHQD